MQHCCVTPVLEGIIVCLKHSVLLFTPNNISILVRTYLKDQTGVLWRILCLPGNVYKDVVLTILNKCFQCKNDADIGTGPIQDMYKAVCEYNMKDELIRCIQMGEYGNISERKRLIKRIVWEHERCSSVEGVMSHVSQSWYILRNSGRHTFAYVVDVCRQISTFYCKN